MGSGYLVSGEVMGIVTVLADSIIIDVERLRWVRTDNNDAPADMVLHDLTFSAGLAYPITTSRAPVQSAGPCRAPDSAGAKRGTCRSNGSIAWALDPAMDVRTLRDSVVGLDSGVACPFRFAILRAPAYPLAREWIAFRFDYSLPLRPPGVIMWQFSAICARRDVFQPPFADTAGYTKVDPGYVTWC